MLIKVSEAVTIDFAIEVLQRAKRQMGGDKCLTVSLTGSGLEENNVSSIKVINDPDNEGTYVQLRVKGFEGIADHVVYQD